MLRPNSMNIGWVNIEFFEMFFLLGLKQLIQSRHFLSYIPPLLQNKT
jgi:hypothetical protein